MPIINSIAVMSARGFGFGTEDAFAEQTYTAGTYSFIVPAGVTSISVVAVAGGGGGVTPGNYTSSALPIVWATPPGSPSGNVNAGGGGALAYTNNITVTPGQVLTVVVGAGGTPGSTTFTAGNGGESYLANAGGTKLVHVTGGYGGQTSSGAGGSVVIGTGAAGGAGGAWSPYDSGTAIGWTGAGGGGAGGYSGAGGNGGNGNANGSNGSGGAAGGGGGGGNLNYAVSGGGPYQQYIFGAGGAGGGTGLTGLGSNGAGGVTATGSSSSYTPSTGGGAGSNGVAGGDGGPGVVVAANVGGLYGGGGAIPGTSVRQYDTAPEFRNFIRGSATSSSGGAGGIRIIWTTNPTITRAFPSTNAGNL